MAPNGQTRSKLAADGADPGSSWTLLTNHGHVLVCIARDPDVLLADLASEVGIRERAAHRIVTDLVDAGYVTRTNTAAGTTTSSRRTCRCATRSNDHI